MGTCYCGHEDDEHEGSRGPCTVRRCRCPLYDPEPEDDDA